MSIVISDESAFLYLKMAAFVALTALFVFAFDKQSFGYQKCSAACFDKWKLIMIDN